ncbi:MAG: glucodextranase DOMON-like domain-containing protein [Gammaproteobacteria bacterium]|nr:glucodextranase DOMON-like domain-containing protein [Gammaproteobacteria bacterium]
MFIRTLFIASAALAAGITAAQAQVVTLTDPTGDDNGPGTYIYPTDAAYPPGSFDLTELKVEVKGKNVNFKSSVNQRLDDPWGMDVGFAVQMIFIFIDTDRTEGSGHTDGLPGLNIEFAPEDAWDKVIVLSPQPASRVQAEVASKAADKADDILIPRRTTGRGKSISAKVKVDDIGSSDPATWGYQVVMQSNEGFPAKGDLLTRRVNEFEGQHRFGGGHDLMCDPHLMDVIAGDASGAPEEVALQHEMLSYSCSDDGSADELAKLTMVRR